MMMLLVYKPVLPHLGLEKILTPLLIRGIEK